MLPIPQNYCQFYIVRHGETDWNRLGKMQGQLNSELTNDAIDQSRELGMKLHNIQFSAVFSSDLARATQTANLIKLEKEAAVISTKLLRERNLGIFEGQNPTQLNKELKTLLYKLDQESLSPNEMEEFKIESAEQVLSRSIRFFRQTALAYPNQRILVVTHGGVMARLLIKLGYQNLSSFPQLTINNLGYFILNSDGVELDVVGTDNISITENAQKR